MNSKRILLVEDNATVAGLYRGLLERTGAKVHIVSDGSDAFIEAHQQVYDVLVLDVMLPNMDGLAILRRLRAQKRFAKVPIFVCSGGDPDQIEPLALEAGATRVFCKSTPAREVVDAIVAMVGTSRKSAATPAEGGGDTEYGTRSDFRVQTKGPSETPALRMKEMPPPPPPPPPPKPQRIGIREQEEQEPPKKGLLSRWFSRRPKGDEAED